MPSMQELLRDKGAPTIAECLAFIDKSWDAASELSSLEDDEDVQSEYLAAVERMLVDVRRQLEGPDLLLAHLRRTKGELAQRERDLQRQLRRVLEAAP